jgi:hypothetical protein
LRRFWLAIAAGKIANFDPRKVALKSIFRLQEKNLCVKAGQPQQFFSWSQRGLGNFGGFCVFEVFMSRDLGNEANPKSATE